MYTPINAPSNVATINDQFPMINCKTMLINAVTSTSNPICLFSLIEGTNIATNNAYNDMLKLFATITGSKSNIMTPIIAPSIHDNHDVNEIPIYVHMDESFINEKRANDSSVTKWADSAFNSGDDFSALLYTQTFITKYLRLTTKLVSIIAIALAPFASMDAAIISPAPAYTNIEKETVCNGLNPAFIARAA